MAPLLIMQAGTKPPALKCDLGPIERHFGNGDWIVYACADGKTVVVVAKPGNPAGQFVFILSPKEGHYAVYGEGSGPKAESDAAGDAIRVLGDGGIAALGDAARAAAK